MCTAAAITYFYVKHPTPSGYQFIGEARIVRVGPEAYGVYTEPYSLF
jgi:hypothetical protein